GIFKECNELLVTIQKALDSFIEVDRQRVANLAKRLAWPLKEKEVADALQRLSRLRGIISTAIETTLSRIETTQTKLLDVVTGLRSDLRSYRDGKSFRDILTWLCPSPSRERDKTLQRNLALRLPGSGKWFLNSKEYVAWKQDPGDHLIWINGLPGGGKSVLFSGIIQDLQSTSTVKLPGDVILYYVCTPGSDTYTESPTVQFLKDLSFQFVASSKACYDLAFQMWKRKKGSSLDLSEYIPLLHTFISQCSRIYLLVDALDETSWQDPQETRTFLETLTHLTGCDKPSDKTLEGQGLSIETTWKVLLTSRMHALISRWTGSWRRGLALTVSIDTSAKPDLENFVSVELSRRLDAGRLRLRNAALKQEIISEITRHGGTFLHATLQLDTVTNTRSDKEVRTVLQNLKSGLDATYEQILSTAARKYPKRVEEMKEILELLVVVNTLSCSAIAEQLSIAPGDTCLDLDSIVTEPEDVVMPLSQLIHINRSEEDGQSYVKLCHFTVREFLTSDAVIKKGDAAEFYVNWEDAHTRILTKYLQYLSFSDFDNIELVTAMRTYDLLSHAAHSWPHHLRFSRVWERHPSHFQEQILPYLDWFMAGNTDNRRFKFWRSIQILSDYQLNHPAYSHASHPLAFSIAHGMDCLVDILLPRFANGDLNAHFADGHTCLTTAASRNQLNLAKRLLDAGANVDTPTTDRELTPLHIAAESAFEEMVTLLLDAGASPHARSMSGSTPFYRAARGGSPRILRQLHAVGSEVDASTWDDWTPLMEAVEHGNDEAVELLLGWGADPTRMSHYGTTPLELATD
ncbi:hypothetical protein P885DRAFT_23605, partial [Corynascus similis CBS 632.67]